MTGRRLTQLARIPVDELRAVGPRRAAALGALGIETVLDLLTHYPHRYEDWTRLVAIGALGEGDQASVVARVARVSRRRTRGGRSLVQAVLEDETGRLACTFFNQAWRAGQLAPGVRVVASGRVGDYRGQVQMANPAVQVLGEEAEDAPDTSRLTAIYPESERARVASAALRRYVAEALERAGPLADPLPEHWRRRLGLVGRSEAFSGIHRPSTGAEHRRARRRLAFDELWRLQVALVMRKRADAADARGIAHVVTGLGAEHDLVAGFLARLPFPLTPAQARALDEIAADLAAPVPMHRLLQGDVGSGKTVVALAALLVGVQGGHQGALMVPTEVLAEQHLLAARALLDGLEVADPGRLGGRRPVRVELLTSRTSAGERARLRDPDGLLAPEIVVGTHALITDEVRFRSLGVVVIDEQHRFGVDQRARLREKGSAAPEAVANDPDLLVMTATPIPRTAAMHVYGDLDQSVLDELPAGRVPVATRWLRDGEAEAWATVRAEVAAGHQAFVICPLVGLEGGEEDEVASPGTEGEAGPAPRARTAVAEAAGLAAGELSGLSVGLLHGQLPAREKQEVMAAFRDGALDVLVATTVVEVGVDVPNATVIVIEDADRFGIAQLHQLRGRVGRSGAASTCLLVAGEPSDEATRRLEALEATADGFALAEVDLELRGEGTVLGARQKGRSDLKLASLARDRDLVHAARRVAEAVVAADPDLAGQPLLADELRLFLDEDEAAYLFRS